MNKIQMNVTSNKGAKIRLFIIITYALLIFALVDSTISAFITSGDVHTQDLTLMLILVFGSIPAILYLILSRFIVSYYDGVNKFFKGVFYLVVLSFIVCWILYGVVY